MPTQRERRIGNRTINVAEPVPAPPMPGAVTVAAPWILMATPEPLGIAQVMVARLRGADAAVPVYELVKSYNTAAEAIAYIDGVLTPREEE